MGKYSNTTDFIEKSKIVHGDKFSYNKSTYVSSKTDLIITCKIHGDFNQKPSIHLSGSGCKKCINDPMVKRKKDDYEEIIVPENCKYILLTRGKYAIVDEYMYEYFSNNCWTAYYDGCNYYARRKTKDLNGIERLESMHRSVMGLPIDTHERVDHINNNTLDNRRDNLRMCSFSENSRNRRSARNSASKYLGVTVNTVPEGKNWKKWCCLIKSNNITQHIGSFHSEEEAARAYDKKAKELHGEFANLNFPQE